MAGWGVMMGRVVAVLAVTVGIVVGSGLVAGSGHASDPKDQPAEEAPISYKTVEECLDSQATEGDDPLICVGVISRACLDALTDRTAVAQSECIGKELAEWNTLLDAELAIFKKAITDSKKAEAFNAAQSLWRQSTDVNCGLADVFLDGGTMARIIGPDCALQETGWRVLSLRGLRALIEN